MDLTLPYVCLQADYLQAYNDVAQSLHTFEKVWLSVYCLNAPNASIHTKLLLASQRGGKVDVELEEEGKAWLDAGQTSDNKLDFVVASTSTSASHDAKQVSSSISLPPTMVQIPKRTVGPVVKGSLGVTAFDISQSGQYVVGGADGQAHVASLGLRGKGGEEDDREGEGDAGLDDIERLARQRMRRREQERPVRTELRGHVGDLRSARFFPSGEVVLTTSSDCTARIFGLDGSNPRTLTGHRRAVTSSYLIGKGREVLTCSSDGTTRLWDVGQGVQSRVFASHKFSGVNAVSMGRVGKGENHDEGHLIVTGLLNGVVECHDRSSGSSVFTLPTVLFPSGQGPQASDRWEQVSSGAIESLDWSRDTNLLLAGCSNGVTVLHDMRMLSSRGQGGDGEMLHDNRSLLASWRRNGAAVNEVRLLGRAKQAVLATADGTPYRLDFHSGTPTVTHEYNGWDVDNVQSVGLDPHSRVWLAGAGGYFHMY